MTRIALTKGQIERWKREGAQGASMRKYIFAHEWETLCDLALKGLSLEDPEANETARPEALRITEEQLWAMVRSYHGFKDDAAMVDTLGYSMELYVEKMRQAFEAAQQTNTGTPVGGEGRAAFEGSNPSPVAISARSPLARKCRHGYREENCGLCHPELEPKETPQSGA